MDKGGSTIDHPMTSPTRFDDVVVDDYDAGDNNRDITAVNTLRTSLCSRKPLLCISIIVVVAVTASSSLVFFKRLSSIINNSFHRRRMIILDNIEQIYTFNEYN